jgi:hypothetical protein
MMTAIMPWDAKEGKMRKKERRTELISKEVDDGERGRSVNGGRRRKAVLL